MIVTYVWSRDCDTCRKFGMNHVIDDIADCIAPIPSVHWDPFEVNLIGSTDPHDHSSTPPIRTDENGNLSPVVVFENSHRRIEDQADEIYTPCFLLQHDGETEQVDIAEYTGQIESNVVEEAPWRACRSLMKKLFRFYLDHVIDTSQHNKMIMRQEHREGSVQSLEPPYEYGEFKPNEWRNAFTRARQVQY